MTGSSSAPPLVRLTGIVRRFGPVTALDGADLQVEKGRIHGVLGENGAGKSTLLNVLGGMVQPDAGDIHVAGQAAELPSPRAAWALGIGMVHQHFKLVPRLTVLENLALGGRGDTPRWSRPTDPIRSRVDELMRATGLSVPWDASVEELGVGDRQRIEILKALLREPRVLVLDEPTAVLAPAEVDGLFALLRRLAGEGTAVVVVAHKLDEILSVADTVTVLRKGRTVLEAARSDVDATALAAAMVGSDEGVDLGAAGVGAAPGTSSESGVVVATLDGVSLRGRGAAPRLEELSLELRRGEVVGIAGVEGNGQRELARLLADRSRPDAGRVTLPEGVGFIPQDRTSEGLALDLTLTENVALGLHGSEAYRRGPWLRWGFVGDRAEEILRRFRVMAPSVGARAGSLSGGNQQRVVVGRELALAADLLVAENPTRGLDVAAAAFVHEELSALRARGPDAPAVLLVSTDLDEVLALSDRVFAMVRGRLLPVPPELRTRSGVGEIMLSGSSA